MNALGPWSVEDFEQMSWHDVHVHGFAFAAFDSEEGLVDAVGLQSGRVAAQQFYC